MQQMEFGTEFWVKKFFHSSEEMNDLGVNI